MNIIYKSIKTESFNSTLGTMKNKSVLKAVRLPLWKWKVSVT